MSVQALVLELLSVNLFVGTGVPQKLNLELKELRTDTGWGMRRRDMRETTALVPR